ncbi:MAG TPA: HAMP domain-containing protein, partial [Thermoanaerobaculia bacterium]|nr:HAMP domain-containing protein [Thermoanaerobaculia bacterium]
LEDNFRRGLYALLGVFGVGLVVILVVTRNATRPVEAVAEAARQVADGQLDVVVPVDRADEIGQLAIAFNRMTAALRERQ